MSSITSLPSYVLEGLDNLLKEKDLTKEFTDLSQHYRHNPKIRGYVTQGEHLAYLQTRLPATYAVVRNILSQIDLKALETVLDIGAGPGTSAFALDSLAFKGDITLLEQDLRMQDLSRDLLKKKKNSAQLTFINQSIENFLAKPHTASYDLISLSYVMNEWREIHQQKMLESVLGLCKKYLVLIYPGKPSFFKEMVKVRDWLIQKGWFIEAPCTHILNCPLQKSNNWCHFSVRLERQEGHRKAKKATLTYEDEKYCYLIATPFKKSIEETGRVIFPPIKKKGHIIVDVCKKGNIERYTIGKSNPSYSQVKDLEWGGITKHELVTL